MKQEDRDRAEFLSNNPEVAASLMRQLENERRPIEGLICGKGGVPKPCLANAIIFLREDPEWQGVLAYNEFSLRVVAKRPAPWQTSAGANWSDYDDSRTAEWLQHHGVMVTSAVAAEAVQTVAKSSAFHPVRDYLKRLKWDGTPRIGTWLITYMGAEDTPLIRAIGECWLIAACARIFRPGCQSDYTLLLEGSQGIGKSSALRVLAGDEWFTDHLSDLGDKDSRIELHGRWIIEISELDRVRRGERERVKAFLTARFDQFRLPYGRRAESVPRSCAFAATTNDDSPFSDETGNRRFWPVRCSTIDVAGLQHDRDQFWAEAYFLYQADTIWWLDTTELNEAATNEQNERYEGDPWDDVILEWCSNPRRRSESGEPCISEPYKVTIADVLVHAIGKSLKEISQMDRNRVSRCLIHDSWKRKQDRTRGPHRGKHFFWKYDID